MGSTGASSNLPEQNSGPAAPFPMSEGTCHFLDQLLNSHEKRLPYSVLALHSEKVSVPQYPPTTLPPITLLPQQHQPQQQDFCSLSQYQNITVVDTYAISGRIEGKLKCFLQQLTVSYPSYLLIQLWAPVMLPDRKYLTNAKKPFGLKKLHQGLCSYRKHCQDHLIPVEEFIPGGHLGPYGRVFLQGLPEFSIDVRYYSTEEYPQRDHAVHFGIESCMVLPMFMPPDLHRCIGVLEIVSASKYVSFEYQYDLIVKNLKDMGLRSSDVYNFDSLASEDLEVALHEIHNVMKVACQTHQLPVAQIWVASSNASCIQKVVPTDCRSYALPSLGSLSAANFAPCRIQKGQGAVGKAFSSRRACFCNDIKQLNVSEYSLVLNARKLGLSSCFAICLQSTRGGDSVYVLEFFLPCTGIDNGDPRILLSKLLVTMEQEFKHFKVASGQELGDKLLVETIKMSLDDPLDSFEIYDTASAAFTNRISGNEDEILFDTLNQQVEVTGNEKNDICSEQNELDASPETILQQDSSPPQSMVELDNGVNEGREVVGQLQCNIGSSNKGNQGLIRTLDIEYGITREVLEQHSQKKLVDVVNILGVSRSTLKRICRKHNIFRWPPRIRNPTSSHNRQEIIRRGKKNIDVVTKGDDITVEDVCSVTVKATYKDDMMKFPLPLSSRKLVLELEVAKRINLPVGSFKIKYVDEENDYVVIVCDEDLTNCINTSRSLGRTTIKMLVYELHN